MKYSVLFDMDGVLTDSEPVINAAAIMGLKEYGINAKPEDFHPFIGTGEDRYIGGVAEKYGFQYKVEMKHRVYEIFLDIVNETIKVFEGVTELLEFLKSKGVKMAIASSTDRIKLEASLKASGISMALFDAVISGEDVANKKPAPDIYLMAAAKIGAKPEDCIVVEDAVNGIKSAKAAGMKCIAVASSFGADVLKKENPDHICSDLKEVQGIFNKLL